MDLLSPPWTLHLRASMGLLSACNYTDDVNILTLYSFLIPFMSYSTDSPMVCSSSFSWICAIITSSKKSSLLIQPKEVHSQCPIILHLITPFYECINLSHLFTWLFAHCPSPVRMQAPSKQCLSCLLLVSWVPRTIVVHNGNQLWLDCEWVCCNLLTWNYPFFLFVFTEIYLY